MGVLPDTGPVADRLGRDSVAWLTTVTPDGRPQSSVVWFLVHDGAIYLQSQPGAAKVKNIRAHRGVSLHLNSDEWGGHVVTIDAEAEILDRTPPDVWDAYLAKYERSLREDLQMTPEQMAADYGTTVRVTPRRLRHW